MSEEKIKEILSLVRTINADEFGKQITEGDQIDNILLELKYLYNKQKHTKDKINKLINHISECCNGNFFKKFPITEDEDELDVISMGFNTFVEELDATMVSKEKLEKTNRELTSAKELAENLSKTKDRFIANISHELRTPLNGILGFTNLLIEEKLTESQLKQLSAIKTSGEHLLIIVNDVLDMAKIQSGQMKIESAEIDLVRICKKNLSTFEYLIKEKYIEFYSYFDPEIPSKLLGDPNRFAQIIQNIVGNAFKFTENHGRISFSLKQAQSNNESSLIEIKISDSGVGIPKHKLEEIFKPFVQTSDSSTRKFGGTGLGLSIVKSLVDLMKGDILVESIPNQGSTFTILIPYTKIINSNKDNIPKQSSEGPKSVKILLAEDNPINSLLVKQILIQLGLDVHVAENGLKCIELYTQGDYDLILMDIMMPEMDGYDATIHIREKMVGNKSMIPIIAMTADINPSCKAKCEAVGMNDYISKPFAKSELLQKMSKFVDLNIDPSRTIL